MDTVRILPLLLLSTAAQAGTLGPPLIEGYVYSNLAGGVSMPGAGRRKVS